MPPTVESPLSWVECVKWLGAQHHVMLCCLTLLLLSSLAALHLQMAAFSAEISAAGIQASKTRQGNPSLLETDKAHT